MSTNPDLLPQSNPENQPAGDVSPNAGDDSKMLAKAKQIFEDSTTYLESSVRKDWERNLAHFMGRHAPGSKYYSAAYKNRSKAFRPRTRYGLRSSEAALATSLFSNADLMAVEANDKKNPQGSASAAVVKALLQHRLTKTIPWYLTAIGAYQDCNVYGVCASYQYWHFAEIEEDVQITDPESQQTLMQKVRTVVKDEPCIDLMPPENLRFDPAADWRDPINSSPYVVRVVPMYVGEIMEKAKNKNVAVPWRDYTEAELRSAKTEYYDSTRRSREEGRVDPAQAQTKSESLVWLHENFVRRNHVDYVFWTVGTTLILSDEVPTSEAYPHLKGKRRPVVLGIVVPEAHRNYPSSPSGLSSSLQESSNEIANQRFDNVQLVLNKRYFIKRGQQVDLDALMRNVPGGGVMVDNPQTDVNIVSTPDVTQSSYEEQDRLDSQIDEMHGTFSTATVGSNRELNETVGGMQMSGASAGAMTDYGIRTFVETWAEPVLRQVAALEQYYESDQTVLALAQEDAQLFQKFGIDKVTDDLLAGEVTLTINLGIGSTNPQQKVERITYGISSITQLSPAAAARLNEDEVIKEVFGALGYKDGGRFFKPAEEAAQPQEDPQIAMKRMEIEAEEKNAEKQRQHDWQLEQARIRSTERLGFAKLALQEDITYNQLRTKLRMDAEAKHTNSTLTLLKDRTTRETTALKETNKQNEMALKLRTGSGI